MVVDLAHVGTEHLRDVIGGYLERAGWTDLLPDGEIDELIDEHVEILERHLLGVRRRHRGRARRRASPTAGSCRSSLTTQAISGRPRRRRTALRTGVRTASSAR